MCLLGPATYSPVLALVTVPIIILFGLGIEMVFHRMLCHKAFSSPKWWEYTMAYFGILNIQVCYLLRNFEGHESWCLHNHTMKTLSMPCSPTYLCTLLVYAAPLAAGAPSSCCAAFYSIYCFQGDPIEWVSDHRYHHAHTDTPLDPHSPYDGYFWAHIGWLWDNEVRTLTHFFIHTYKPCTVFCPKPPTLL